MGRPRQFPDAAARQRAHRAREQLVDPELPEVDLSEPEPAPLSEPREMIEFEGQLLPVTVKCSWTEEQYVQHELAITKSQLERGGVREIEHNGESTLQRSERYLRWRYSGFRVGVIAAL